MPRAKLVVLISGSGSNLQALIDACEDRQLDADIVLVISNRADAFGLQRAREAGIENDCIDHKQFACREEFDRALAERINACTPDLVILAGFMRILTPAFVTQFYGRLVNIHPSLLPKYPGLDTHQRAIDAGDSYAGATVHFVTPELDGGPPILHVRVPVQLDDSADSLAARVLEYEHQLYVEAVRWFVAGRLRLENGSAVLDGKTLPANGNRYAQ